MSPEKNPRLFGYRDISQRWIYPQIPDSTTLSIRLEYNTDFPFCIVPHMHILPELAHKIPGI